MGREREQLPLVAASSICNTNARLFVQLFLKLHENYLEDIKLKVQCEQFLLLKGAEGIALALVCLFFSRFSSKTVG